MSASDLAMWALLRTIIFKENKSFKNIQECTKLSFPTELLYKDDKVSLKV